MLTEGAVVEAGDALVELLVFSCFNLVFGLENDLKMSEGCLFAADGLLAGFFSAFLGPSAFVSGATTAFDIE